MQSCVMNTKKLEHIETSQEYGHMIEISKIKLSQLAD